MSRLPSFRLSVRTDIPTQNSCNDGPFCNAAELLIHPDHVFRMLYSQGVALEDLGIGNAEAEPRESWRLFAERYHLFRGTPLRMWLDLVFAEAFGLNMQFSAEWRNGRRTSFRCCW